MSKVETLMLAEHAKKVLENPAWIEFTEGEVKKGLLEMLDVSDEEALEIKHALCALTDLVARFESAILSGDIAAEND